MQLILNAGIALGLLLAMATMVYTMLILPRKFFRETENQMDYRCKTCGTVHRYSNEQSLDITTKPRNSFRGIGVYKVSYRYPCDVCNCKTQQEPLSEQFSPEQQTELRQQMIRMGFQLLVFIALAMTCGILLDRL